VLHPLCLALLIAPAISQNGVVNTASRIPPTLAGGALAPGSLFTIYGVRFGSSESTTTVTLQHGPTTIAAKVIAVQPKRIDAWLPVGVPLGPALLTVSVNGQPSDSFKVNVDKSNPGLFSRNGEGWGPALPPAHPGQRVSLLGTGFGPGEKVTVVVGGRPVLAGSPRATSQLGQQQVRFTIPANVPVGCYVPVYVLATPGRAGNVVTIAVQPPGEPPCDPGPLDRSARLAVFARSRMRARRENRDIVSDEALVTFTAQTGRALLSPLLLLPPPGACTAYTSSFQAETILPNSISAAIVAEVNARGLRAGSSLTLTKGSDQRTIPQDGGTSGYYRAQLGSSDQRRRRALFLDPGDFTFAGPGGPDVAPFSFRVHAADPFEWTDREATSQVDRGRPLTVHWKGLGSDRTVLILATNVDQITTAIGTTLCAAPATAGQFTIPAALLANLPASMDIPGVPYDQLLVVSIPVRGLDAGAIVSLYAIGRIVEYR
jgi:uncharacterized protein (TIGR03437 family)